MIIITEKRGRTVKHGAVIKKQHVTYPAESGKSLEQIEARARFAVELHKSNNAIYGTLYNPGNVRRGIGYIAVRFPDHGKAYLYVDNNLVPCREVQA